MLTKIATFLHVYCENFLKFVSQNVHIIAGYLAGGLIPSIIFPSTWPMPLATYFVGAIAFLVYYGIVIHRLMKNVKKYKTHRGIDNVSNGRCRYCGLARDYWKSLHCLEEK